MATQAKRKLTDAFVRNVKAPTKDDRDHYPDTDVPGFLLRVTRTGAKSYVLNRRWPNGEAEKRTVGDARVMRLAEARAKARSWLDLVEKGIDPQQQEREKAEAEAREKAITFANLAEDYINEDLAKKRRARQDALEIRRHIVSRWGKLPATSINAGYIVELAKELKGVPATGRLILSHVKRIFGWAMHEHDKKHGNRYGLTVNPAAGISPKRLFGAKKPRDRTLDDDELRALLVACRDVPYPIGPCVELLLLTGCRREEIAQAQWSEIKDDVLIVPPGRFKSGVSHRVPLSTAALALIGKLPRHAGPYMFTTTNGKKAVNGWSNSKEEIDRVMAGELGREVEHWVLHDLRHCIRSRMAGLGVRPEVAEMCLGHGKRGLERVYNEHAYQNEQRAAYQQWADLLRDLVTRPGGDNVIAIKRARRKQA
jgi:integrase